MSNEPDINDMREKLRRQKKEKEASHDSSHLLGSKEQDPHKEDDHDDVENNDEDVKTNSAEENIKENSQSADEEYHYNESQFEDSEIKNEKQVAKGKKNFKIPKIKITPARIIILVVILFIIILGGIIWYAASSASDVKEITYSGNEVITDEELSNRLQFEEGDKMFSINTTQATENIELLPVIIEATVEREWWNTVHVNVEEHRIIAYIENEEGFNPVMENARILRGYPISPSNGPILYHFEGEELEDTVSELKNINNDILANISEIYYSPSDTSQTRIHLFMNDGQEIVGDYRDFGEKMNHYVGMKQEIGDDNEGIIDIEIGSSFLPYGSREAEEIKSGIYDEPVQADHVDEINDSLSGVKDILNQMDREGDSEDDENDSSDETAEDDREESPE